MSRAGSSRRPGLIHGTRSAGAVSGLATGFARRYAKNHEDPQEGDDTSGDHARRGQRGCQADDAAGLRSVPRPIGSISVDLRGSLRISVQSLAKGRTRSDRSTRCVRPSPFGGRFSLPSNRKTRRWGTKPRSGVKSNAPVLADKAGKSLRTLNLHGLCAKCPSRPKRQAPPSTRDQPDPHQTLATCQSHTPTPPPPPAAARPPGGASSSASAPRR
jgi:hypothetical protein